MFNRHSINKDWPMGPWTGGGGGGAVISCERLDAPAYVSIRPGAEQQLLVNNS